MSTNHQLIFNVKKAFLAHFDQTPTLIQAPGRINVIGEHTDYNDGFVLPAATNQAIYIAISKSQNATSTLIALDLDESHTFDIKKLEVSKDQLWANYIMGVLAEVKKAGHELENINMVFSGDVPRGSGMSSSAALECGTCFGINEIFHLDIEKVEMVKMSQKAEHNFVGVMCGIMDQFASMMGAADKALLLDCKTLEYRHFPLELKDYSLLLCNSNVSHSLADSEYNTRRLQCEEGVAVLQKYYPAIASLRDVTLDQLKDKKAKLSDVTYLRCKYVIEENARVLEMTQAMEQGNFDKVGALLKKAQHGMRYEYEITCAELDFMADFANERADILGARMMGGGFGGCTINFVKKGAEDQFIEELNTAYQAAFSKEITPIKVIISDGVHLI